jgi:carboxyl-terminal processing protease
MHRKLFWNSAAGLIAVICLTTVPSRAQKISNRDREQALTMLQEVSSEVAKHYYDPKLHGVDWDATINATRQKINAAPSAPRALSEVAAALQTLNDSHTFLLPPAYSTRYYYGWQAQMVQDRCFVTRVRAGSDAEKKGLRPGDEIVALNGFAPTRDTLWKMEYIIKTLRPQPGLVLDVRDPAGKELQLPILTKMVRKQQILDVTGSGSGADIWDLVVREQNEADDNRDRFAEAGDVGILKFPSFNVNPSEIDRMIGKAHKHRALVLDLRGDPGGNEETLKYLVAACFGREVKIGDRIGRSVHKPIVAKSRSGPFTGKLIVLVDSQSASAAELFARVVQIEKRGTVIGDLTSGSVMEARHYTYHLGLNTVIFYGASITDADIIMPDGKTLEHAGVHPDEIEIPSAADVAAGRDPVLSRAVSLAGGTLSPEKAGKLFPYRWPQI